MCSFLLAMHCSKYRAPDTFPWDRMNEACANKNYARVPYVSVRLILRGILLQTPGGEKFAFRPSPPQKIDIGALGQKWSKML